MLEGIGSTKVPQSRYRCRRSRQIYFLLGYGCVLLFGVMTAAFALGNRPGGNRIAAASITAVALLASIWLVVRAQRSATLEVFEDRLVYTSIMRQSIMWKSQLERIDVDLRYRPPSPIQFQQPRLEYCDGHSEWLPEFSVRPAKEGEIAGEGVEQVIMVLELSEWLRT